MPVTARGTESAAAADRTAEVAGDGYRAEVIVSALNRRLQVTRIEGERLAELAAHLRREASRLGFGKVWAKVSGPDARRLEEAGFEREAVIRGYFAGEDGHVMAAFLAEERRVRPFEDEQHSILAGIRSNPPDPTLSLLPEGYRLAVAAPADADELAALYREVFASYPFPIMDPGYLVETMRSHVVYRIVRDGLGAVVAAASAETSAAHRNAEMTDFATLPSQRRLGLAQHLLAALEDDMAGRGIDHLYTIARARSFGMNRVFYNRGYVLTGTLVNNCHIAGQFEDMHVWCREEDGVG